MSEPIEIIPANEIPRGLNDHSDEVQEIFERAPGWALRFGIMVIATLVVLALAGSIIIKYPDILATRVSITTRQPPINVVSRVGGKIHFSVADGENVNQDQVLGYIENASNAEDVFRLTEEVNTLQGQLFDVDAVDPKKLVLSRDYQLGDLQPIYLEVLNDIRAFQRNEQLQALQTQIRALEERITQYSLLNEQLKLQRVTQDEEFKFAEKKFKMDQKLFEQNVIAEADFNTSNVNYLQVKRSIQVSNNNVINNNIAISELKSRIGELSLTRQEDLDLYTEAIRSTFKQLESRITAWRQQYLLVAPSTGIVSIFKFYTEDQYIQPGVDILAIVPGTESIYGQVQLPIDGSGKVEIGQRVVIRLDNFPAREYGTIMGIVETISSLPKDNQYTIRIQLPDGLKTTYKVDLPFRQQLSGSAEIITRDLSLFQRVFYSVRSLVDRASI